MNAHPTHPPPSVQATPEPESPPRPARRILEPIERVSEVLFGLIMVLTFTGSLSVAEAAHEDVRSMLIGAVGCNLAWGIVDAIMYLMSSFTERARGRMALRAVRGAHDPAQAHGHIAGALPPVVASILDKADLESMRLRLTQMPDPPGGPLLGKREWLGALAVFLLVFFSTLPVVVPFMFVDNARLALRLSNGIAIVMLFFCGYSLGRFAGQRPWLVGLIMVVVGVVLAGMTLALGG
jgi:VIT1/CCC1 family predicted Fe2+/Mn2+ transporter